MFKGLLDALERARVVNNARAILYGRNDRMRPKGSSWLYDQLDTQLEELRDLKKSRKAHFLAWLNYMRCSGQILTLQSSERRDRDYCYINEELGVAERKAMRQDLIDIAAKCRQIEATTKEIELRWYPNRQHPK